MAVARVGTLRGFHLVLILIALFAAILVGCSKGSGDWVPTESDPVRVDQSGNTWGIPYVGESGETVEPDWVYVEGAHGAVGYASAAEYEEEMGFILSGYPAEPGFHEELISLDLYGLESSEKVGVLHIEALSEGVTEEYLANINVPPFEASEHAWVPSENEPQRVGSDGRTWGIAHDGVEPDMRYVELDKGELNHGYVFAESEAEAETFLTEAHSEGPFESVAVLIAVGFDDDETVVGQYVMCGQP